VNREGSVNEGNLVNFPFCHEISKLLVNQFVVVSALLMNIKYVAMSFFSSVFVAFV
jgi:hypothetical protein